MIELDDSKLTQLAKPIKAEKPEPISRLNSEVSEVISKKTEKQPKANKSKKQVKIYQKSY